MKVVCGEPWNATETRPLTRLTQARLYAYLISGTVTIVLADANANDDPSWSHFVHAKIELLLFGVKGGVSPK
jgi:hypothetical protein